MNFVSIWKACSIVLTGAFGILGLLTEFKDKDSKKITKWGRVSLIGIVVSTILGVVAQIKESSDDAAKSLKLAQKADRTLTELHRQLSSLTTASVSMGFKVPCDRDRFVVFCRELRNMKGRPEFVPSSQWKHSPFFQPLLIQVGFVRKGETPKDYVEFNAVQNTSLTFLVEGPTRRNNADFEAWILGGDVELLLDNPSLGNIQSDGSLISLFDLHGTTVAVGPNPLFDALSLTRFRVILKDGEEAGFDVDRPDIEVGRLQTKNRGSIYVFKCP